MSGGCGVQGEGHFLARVQGGTGQRSARSQSLLMGGHRERVFMQEAGRMDKFSSLDGRGGPSGRVSCISFGAAV